MNRLLLIEDSIDDQELIKRAIRKSGHDIEISIADNGVAALEVLEINNNGKAKVLPNLILLDLKIPKLSGKEVLQEIRSCERTKMLPVVVFTSSIESSDLFDCYQMNVNSFIRKPVNADDFYLAIEMILNY